MRPNGIAAVLSAGVCIAMLATPAHAEQRRFNIPPGSLKAALDAYGRQSGRAIIYKADEVQEVRSAGFRGTSPPQDALNAILDRTGFTARFDDSGAIAIMRLAAAPSSQNHMTTSPQDEIAQGEIVVTAQKREQALSDVPMAIQASISTSRIFHCFPDGMGIGLFQNKRLRIWS